MEASFEKYISPFRRGQHKPLNPNKNRALPLLFRETVRI